MKKITITLCDSFHSFEGAAQVVAVRGAWRANGADQYLCSRCPVYGQGGEHIQGESPPGRD